MSRVWDRFLTEQDKEHLANSRDRRVGFGKRPAILVIHDRAGMQPYTLKHTETWASLGYVAFAADFFGYGQGVLPKDVPEAQAQMGIYTKDRALMKARAKVGYDTLLKNPMVDASKVALVHLVARMRLGGFRLLDTQFVTAHLARFGMTSLQIAVLKANVPARRFYEAMGGRIIGEITVAVGVDEHACVLVGWFIDNQ